MKVRLLRAAVPALLGAAVAMLPYAAFALLRDTLRYGAPWANPIIALFEVALVGGLGALGAALGAHLSNRFYRDVFRQLSGHVAALRKDPAPHALLVKGGPLADLPELSAVRGELERL